jgi:MerR family transcriptional regulator, light-induced transcriptional regulator
MNLSRLVSIAKSKTSSSQDDSSLNRKSSSNNSNSIWEDCLVADAPSQSSSETGDGSHPLEKACTEEEYLSSLVKTIENNILPIIVEQHLETSIASALQSPPIDPISDKSIAELTKLVLQEDARTSVNYVKEINASGVSLENIYLLLLRKMSRASLM